MNGGLHSSLPDGEQVRVGKDIVKEYGENRNSGSDLIPPVADIRYHETYIRHGREKKKP
jgi:hypothetical protein